MHSHQYFNWLYTLQLACLLRCISHPVKGDHYIEVCCSSFTVDTHVPEFLCSFLTSTYSVNELNYIAKMEAKGYLVFKCMMCETVNACSGILPAYL